jgi:hypothetical protein
MMTELNLKISLPKNSCLWNFFDDLLAELLEICFLTESSETSLRVVETKKSGISPNDCKYDEDCWSSL